MAFGLRGATFCGESVLAEDEENSDDDGAPTRLTPMLLCTDTSKEEHSFVFRSSAIAQKLVGLIVKAAERRRRRLRRQLAPKVPGDLVFESPPVAGEQG